MQKKLIGYTALMGIGLGLAFYASIDTQKDKDLGQIWDTVAVDKIASVQYKAPQINIVVKKIPTGKGYWVDYRREEKISPPAPDANAGQANTLAPGEDKVIEEGFRADSKMGQFFDSFRPLRAERVIGDEKDVKKEDFGLGVDAPVLSFTLEDGKTLTYTIGQKSYGSRNVFLHDPVRKKIILVDGSQIENLADARNRMYERNFYEFDLNDIKKAEIAAENLQVKWDQSERDSNGVLQWKEDQEGASPKPSYKTWMDKVLKVKLQRYASEAERQKIDATPVLLSISFVDSRGPAETLEFRKTVGLDPLSNGADEYWVSSKFLAVPARIPTVRIEPVIKELPSLVGKS